LSSGRDTLQQRTRGNLSVISTTATLLFRDSTNVREIIQHSFILSNLRGQIFPDTIQRNSRHVDTRFISANTFRALQTRQRVFHDNTRVTRTRATLTGKVDQYIVTIDFESKTNTTLLLMRHDKCK